jgi:hypothetical protein
MENTTYVMGIDPYKSIDEGWFKNSLVRLGLRKVRYSQSAIIIVRFKGDLLTKGDVMKAVNDETLTILGGYNLSFFSKIKKFFGFTDNLEYICYVGVVKDKISVNKN